MSDEPEGGKERTPQGGSNQWLPAQHRFLSYRRAGCFLYHHEWESELRCCIQLGIVNPGICSECSSAAPEESGSKIRCLNQIEAGTQPREQAENRSR